MILNDFQQRLFLRLPLCFSLSRRDKTFLEKKSKQKNEHRSGFNILKYRTCMPSMNFNLFFPEHSDLLYSLRFELLQYHFFCIFNKYFF